MISSLFHCRGRAIFLNISKKKKSGKTKRKICENPKKNVFDKSRFKRSVNLGFRRAEISWIWKLRSFWHYTYFWKNGHQISDVRKGLKNTIKIWKKFREIVPKRNEVRTENTSRSRFQFQFYTKSHARHFEIYAVFWKITPNSTYNSNMSHEYLYWFLRLDFFVVGDFEVRMTPSPWISYTRYFYSMRWK